MKKKKILVVEDFASIRNFACEMLSRKGYSAQGAANSEEALKTLRSQPKDFQLVISDYNMPGGTGYELLQNIKQDPSLLHVPVIFLTAESNPEKVLEAKAAGLAAWIRKPYRADFFFEQIRRVLHGTHANT